MRCAGRLAGSRTTSWRRALTRRKTADQSRAELLRRSQQQLQCCLLPSCSRQPQHQTRPSGGDQRTPSLRAARSANSSTVLPPTAAAPPSVRGPIRRAEGALGRTAPLRVLGAHLGVAAGRARTIPGVGEQAPARARTSRLLRAAQHRGACSRELAPLHSALCCAGIAFSLVPASSI